MSMTPDEIKTAVKDAMQEKLGEFYIERERHYKDHEFVTGVREGIGTARKAGIVSLVVSGISALLYAVFGWK